MNHIKALAVLRVAVMQQHQPQGWMRCPCPCMCSVNPSSRARPAAVSLEQKTAGAMPKRGTIGGESFCLPRGWTDIRRIWRQRARHSGCSGVTPVGRSTTTGSSGSGMRCDCGCRRSSRFAFVVFGVRTTPGCLRSGPQVLLQMICAGHSQRKQPRLCRTLTAG